ncbi:CD82 antigen isoform X2 [Agrilus planipennis]|uniref:Tetraspanin n=1 Tax=Agrilus planipennis TaxID=224129 RepID=A0A1W4WN91_AGRPL|nr:CD82 antigen isoform X2 [Agrilus planipennis]
MSAGRCYGIIKYLMVAVNLIFFILSVGIVVISVWMLVDPTFYISLTQDSGNYQISTYIFLFTGLLLLLVSFLGCYGACKESTCLLVSFFSFLLIIIVAQVAIGIWAYTNSDTLEKYVRYAVKSIVQEEYYVNDQRKALFDDIQRGLECCGADRPSDWNPSSFSRVNVTISSDTSIYKIPTSCCRMDMDNSDCLKGHMTTKIGGQIDYDIIFREGCTNKLINRLWYYVNTAYTLVVPIDPHVTRHNKSFDVSLP